MKCTRCGEDTGRKANAKSCLECLPYVNAGRNKKWREQNKEHVASEKVRWREENWERYQENSKKYRADNIDRISDNNRRYYIENKDKMLASMKEWYEKNREARSEYMREYYSRPGNHQKHLDQSTEWAKESGTYGGHKARAEKYGGLVEYVNRDVIAERDGYLCYCCGETIDPDIKWPLPGSLSLEHIIPLSKGGDHTPANCAVSHSGCNLSKGNRVMKETE